MFYRLLFLILFGFISYCDATEYVIQDFGLGDCESRPTSINDHGDVVGIVQIENKQKVFVWSQKTGKKIVEKIPVGAYATQINNKGQVIGSFWSWDGWWSPKWVLHGFLWSEKDGYSDIGAMDYKDTSAISINDVGQVLLITSEDQCYLWEKGSAKKIDSASNVVQHVDFNIVCAKLNDFEAVYLKKDTTDKKSPGVLYRMNLKTRESQRVLDQRKEIPYLTALSQSGKIGGFFMKQGKPEGFLYGKDGSLMTVKNFRPFGMNDDETMVGISYNATERGAIYIKGKLYDINDLMASPDEQPFAYEDVVALKSVNRDGLVIGVVSNWNTNRAVLLTPREKD